MDNDTIKCFLSFCNRIEEALKYYKNKEKNLILQDIVDEICAYDNPGITYTIAVKYASNLQKGMVVQLYKSVLKNKKVQAATEIKDCEDRFF